MRQRHRDVRVEQADRRVELEEGQREHRRRRHAVGQQPEEQVLVAEEAVAREGVGRGQRRGDRDHRVQRDVGDRVHIAHVPGGVVEDRRVVGEREGLRPGREAAEDLVRRLERHVEQPVDRQHQEDDVEGRRELRDAGHCASPHFGSSRVIRV